MICAQIKFQAYSPNKPDDHEKVQWVQFERGDPNG